MNDITSAATPTPGQVASAAEPDWDELTREQAMAEAGKPIPDIQEQLAEMRWYDIHRDDPEVRMYEGQYVAILNGRVVGAGPDPLKLELRCAKEFDVHPARLVVVWVDDGRDLHVSYPDE